MSFIFLDVTQLSWVDGSAVFHFCYVRMKCSMGTIAWCLVRLAGHPEPSDRSKDEAQQVADFIF